MEFTDTHAIIWYNEMLLIRTSLVIILFKLSLTFKYVSFLLTLVKDPGIALPIVLQDIALEKEKKSFLSNIVSARCFLWKTTE